MRSKLFSGRHLVIAIPYLWLLLFFLVPFLIVFKISFSEVVTAVPPYTPLVTWSGERVEMVLNLQNYLLLFSDSLYLAAYLSSIKIAGISTLICLLIGYPMAWAIVHSPPATRNILFMLVILPSWTSFLIRIYAWMGLLSNNGLINNALMSIGLIDTPLEMLNTEFAVYVGIVYAYLPFMVLPLYTALMRLDYSLVEASTDLGARPWQTMFRIVIPLTKGGIIAGSMLVFIPAIGEFVIPELLGGPDTLLIGRVLWQEFFNNRDWPVAAALASTMLLVITLPVLWFHRQQRQEMEKKS